MWAGVAGGGQLSVVTLAATVHPGNGEVAEAVARPLQTLGLAPADLPHMRRFQTVVSVVGNVVGSTAAVSLNASRVGNPQAALGVDPTFEPKEHSRETVCGVESEVVGPADTPALMTHAEGGAAVLAEDTLLTQHLLLRRRPRPARGAISQSAHRWSREFRRFLREYTCTCHNVGQDNDPDG